VQTALELGYRHVDTAQMYGNEHLVGEAIARSEVPRDEIFLATKVDPSNLQHEDVRRSTEESLDRLQTDYVDLLYVHWPIDEYDPEDTLPAFDRLWKRGEIRHVGVSNFVVDTMKTAREILDAPIAANQIQTHPLLPPTEGERESVIAYADAHDIDVVAWSPLARGQALDRPEIQRAAKCGTGSAAQTVLAWLREYGIKPVVKSASRAHLRENLAALEQTLTDSERTQIESVSDRTRLFDRAEAPWNQ